MSKFPLSNYSAANKAGGKERKAQRWGERRDPPVPPISLIILDRIGSLWKKKKERAQSLSFRREKNSMSSRLNWSLLLGQWGGTGETPSVFDDWN